MARDDSKPYYGRCITFTMDKEPWEGEGEIETHEVVVIGRDLERNILFAQVRHQYDSRGLEVGTIVMLREHDCGSVYDQIECTFTDENGNQIEDIEDDEVEAWRS